MSGDVIIAGIRRELREVGFREMRTVEEVDEVLGKYINGEKKGDLLLAINSVCGCAGRVMRPAVAQAVLAHGDAKTSRPVELVTVFAGQDREATEKAREYLVGMPPSSPSVVLMRDGKVAYMMHRNMIEGRSMQEVRAELSEVLGTK